MQWNLSVVASPGTPGNFLVGAIYAATAPSVLIDSVVVPGPYLGAPIQITFLSVNPIVYKYILWENTTATVGGIARNSFDLEPSTSTTVVREDLKLITDSSAGLVSGTSTYVDASLKGWDYEVERVGVGTQYDTGINIVKDTGPTTYGWHMSDSTDLFSPGEKFVIHFYPQVASVSLTAPSPDFVSGADTITTNITLTASDMTRAKFIKGAGPFLTVTLPSIASVQDFKILPFYSYGGSHTTATIQAAGSDLFDYPGGQTLYMNQGEQLKIFKSSGKWCIEHASPDMLKTGEVTFDYVSARLGHVLANGILLDRQQYAGLWAWVLANPAVMVSESAYNNINIVNGINYYINFGRYSDGNGSTTFRLPNLTFYGYVKQVGTGASMLFSGQVGAFNLSLTGPKIPKAGNSNIIVALGNVSDGSLGNQVVNMGIVNPGKENYPSSVGVFPMIKI